MWLRKAGSKTNIANGVSLRVEISGKSYAVHKIIWAMHYREWPATDLDHINGDGLDNRITNLRLATPSQNAMNRRTTKPLPKGITMRNGKYIVRIGINYKRHHLGEFATITEAMAVYKAAADKLHGEFARY